MISRYLVIAGVAILVCACSRTVSRVAPTQTIDLSGRWNDSDSRQVADKMITGLLGSESYKAYAKALGKKPAIIVGLVKNKTSEHIDADTYVKKLEMSLFNSG